MIKTYSELITLKTYEDRFNYLKLNGVVGDSTFGFKRWLNQFFYNTREWRNFRDVIIIRDSGCDLAMPGYEIYGQTTVHHINPITYDDIVNRDAKLFDPENVVCVEKLRTHNAIHYGDESLFNFGLVERKPNDTVPWKI